MSKHSNSAQAPVAGRAERHVFVYGTLRRGGSNDINLRKPAPRFVGTASLQGRLYDLGSYPGLIVASPEASVGSAVKVTGEVYAVLPALEQNLDELEGLVPVPTGEYCKRWMSLEVSLQANTALTLGAACVQQALLCIVYEINPKRTLACALVESGDWIAHCTEKTSGTTRQSPG